MKLEVIEEVDNDNGEPIAVTVKHSSFHGTWEASPKWDGCVNLYRRYEPAGANNHEPDYIHICNLPEFAEFINALLEFSKEHFDPYCEKYK